MTLVTSGNPSCDDSQLLSPEPQVIPKNDGKFKTKDQVTSEDLKSSMHKIIFFISPPRSLSAACARMMSARGDFDVFHEPFHLAYATKAYPEHAKETYGSKTATFESVKEALYEAAKQKPVFVKEVSFDVENFLLNDPEFVQNKNVRFVFLLRNPHGSTVSLYKAGKSCPPNLNTIIGYESLYHIFKKVWGEAKKQPVVMFAEHLSNNHAETIKKLCNELGISFIPKSLGWSNSFNYKDEWHEIKTEEAMERWHGDALRSSGFGKLTEYAKDEHKKPTFEEIVPEYREEYRKCYEHHLQFWEKLMNDPDFQTCCKALSPSESDKSSQV